MKCVKISLLRMKKDTFIILTFVIYVIIELY